VNKFSFASAPFSQHIQKNYKIKNPATCSRLLLRGQLRQGLAAHLTEINARLHAEVRLVPSNRCAEHKIMFGSDMPVATQLLIAALIFLALIGLAWWLVRRSGDQANSPPIPFARVIAEQEQLGAGVGFSALMLIIFSLVALYQYITATTVLQQTVALLILIGNKYFLGHLHNRRFDWSQADVRRL
jgi:hypothetical protein